MNKREYKPKTFSDGEFNPRYFFYPWYLPPIKTELKERLFARGFYYLEARNG